MRLSREVVSALYREHIRGRGFTAATEKAYARDIRAFFRFLDERFGMNDLRQVGRKELERYREFLYDAKDSRGAVRYSHQTRRSMMINVKSVFSFLVKHEYLLSSPFDGYDMRFSGIQRARRSLEADEAGRLLDGIDGDNPMELRDRAIYELMYGTGLRVGEVSRLNLDDVDFRDFRIMVRQGKGKKDRIVPVGSNAIEHLTRYLKRARPYFASRARQVDDRFALFLGMFGVRLGVNAINGRLKKWYGGGNGRICSHMLRHSFATHLLENGAGIKEVKEILGHESIESTMRYTHFSLAGMRKILRRYHPRENEAFAELDDETRKRIKDILKRSR